jgi:hypothetical protein
MTRRNAISSILRGSILMLSLSAALAAGCGAPASAPVSARQQGAALSARPLPWFTFMFKFAGCFGGGCAYPGGICYRSPPFPVDPWFELSAELREQGYGRAEAEVIDERQLRLVFHDEARTEKGTLPVDQEFDLGPEAAKVLGYSSVIVLPGEYEVTPVEGSELGEAYVVVVVKR